MKLKLADLPETLYTPDGQVWRLDSKGSTGLSYTAGSIFTNWLFTEILELCGEVSTEPYPRTFKVGDRIDNEQDAVALPVGAVILDHNNFPLYKAISGDWYKAGVERPCLDLDIHFPATVLWLPEEAGE